MQGGVAGGKSISEKDLDGWVEVGKVRDGHGLKGELFLIFYAREAPWFSQLKSVTCVQTILDKEAKIQEKLRYDLPLIRSKEHKGGIIVKVDGIDDRNQAELLKGARVVIPGALLTSRPGEMVYLREVLGFQVTHEDLGLVGRVTGFSSNGAQDLLVIQVSEDTHQFEVPFLDSFVSKINWENKSIAMTFPAELLDTKIPVQKPKKTRAAP